MVLTYTVAIQFSLTVLSLLFNALGIHCLRKRQGGNKNQHLLLRNLAAVEITKTLYDYVPLTLYHFCHQWYRNHHMYFEIIQILEVNLMTILFSSYVFITLDRLLCATLKTRYKMLITKKLVQNTHLLYLTRYP